MSWYSSDWRIRRSIAVDGSSHAGGASDVAITIDPTDAVFWSAIRSDGADLRVTDSDGTTLLTYKRSTFTYASNILTIHVDNLTVSAAIVKCVFVYVGYSGAGTPSDLVSSFVSGSLLIGRPFLGTPSQRATIARPQRPGDTKPIDTFAKMSAEETYVFVDFGALLLQRQDPYAGRLLWEEVDELTLAQVQSGGAGVSGAWDLSKCRLLDGGVAVYVAAGSSGTSYTIVCRVKTTQARTLEHRSLIRVQNVSEQ